MKLLDRQPKFSVLRNQRFAKNLSKTQEKPTLRVFIVL